MNYSTVLWDWNGTLFDDLDLCHSIYQKLAEKYSFESLSLKEYRNRFRFPLSTFYTQSGFCGSFEELAKDFRELYEEGITSCSLQEGAIDFIKLLNEHGVKQHVISAHNEKDLQLMVDSFGLSDCFESINGLCSIQGGCKVTLAKSVQERENISGDETLFIGDTLHDFDVARSIGSDSWLIARGHVSHQRLAQCDTARTFYSLVGVTSQFERGAL